MPAINTNLTLITICLGGKTYGQGDISAASKLIDGIYKTNRSDVMQVNVTWIFCTRDLREDFPFYESFVKKAITLGANVILSDLTGFTLDEKPFSESLLSNANLLVYFPAISNIPSQISSRIQKYKHKLLSIGEYNLDHHEGGIKTGLGNGRLGIFIEPNIAPQLPLRLDESSDSDRKLLARLNLIDPTTQSITAQKIADYKKDHLLFFGYFALNLDSSSNKEAVNPNKLCEIALHIGSMKGAKNVDIVARLGDNLENLPLDNFADSYSSIEIIARDGRSKIFHLNHDDNLPKARIFDPFPMSQNVFKLLMSCVSEKYFMGLTGDQSLTEGICCGVVIFLQIMSWKKELAHALNEVCHDILPKDAKLLIFNDYVINQRAGNYSPATMARFIVLNQKQLLEEMQIVRQDIQYRFNLIENLIPRLFLATVYPHKANEIFAGYRAENIFDAEQYFDLFDQYYQSIKKLTKKYESIHSNYSDIISDIIKTQSEKNNYLLQLIKLYDNKSFKNELFSHFMDAPEYDYKPIKYLKKYL